MAVHEHWAARAAAAAHGLLQGDGVHPTDAGHALMAEAIVAALLGPSEPGGLPEDSQAPCARSARATGDMPDGSAD